MHEQSRSERFKQEIDQALAAGPYTGLEDRRLHLIYSVYLLRELLAYSAIDQWEVREHIRRLAARANEPRSEQ